MAKPRLTKSCSRPPRPGGDDRRPSGMPRRFPIRVDRVMPNTMPGKNECHEPAQGPARSLPPDAPTKAAPRRRRQRPIARTTGRVPGGLDEAPRRRAMEVTGRAGTGAMAHPGLQARPAPKTPAPHTSDSQPSAEGDWQAPSPIEALGEVAGGCRKQSRIDPAACLRARQVHETNIGQQEHAPARLAQHGRARASPNSSRLTMPNVSRATPPSPRGARHAFPAGMSWPSIFGSRPPADHQGRPARSPHIAMKIQRPSQVRSTPTHDRAQRPR